MLRSSLGLLAEAEGVETAVSRVLGDGYRTADIAKAGEAKVGTEEMGDLVVKALGE
jgi:3-isopropylmalate dehydrogenase